jgi:hypothetical protein
MKALPYESRGILPLMRTAKSLTCPAKADPVRTVPDHLRNCCRPSSGTKSNGKYNKILFVQRAYRKYD